MRMKITSGGHEFYVRLLPSSTSRQILENLPMEGDIKKWGDEIYFYVDLDLPPEDAVDELDVGDVCYWINGPALCIFFGRTPISSDGRPKAASPVNVIGKLENPGDAEHLRKLKEGDKILVEKS
jgi:uncharacterized protein